MQFTDTHSHIYLEEFDDDRNIVIQNSMGKGITKMILPNIDSNSIERLKHCCEEYYCCYPAMGIHPTSITEDYKWQLDLIEKELFENKNLYIGIGEIGLDLYWDKKFYKQQLDVFKKQLDWAAELSLPIIVHSRKSEEIIIHILQEPKYSGIKGVFHCWSGSLIQTQKVVNIGFYIGVGGVVTYKNSNLPEIIKNTDIGKLLLETDSPYLTPVPNRGKRNDSTNITIIAEKIVEILGINVEQLSINTEKNVETLFGL